MKATHSHIKFPWGGGAHHVAAMHKTKSGTTHVRNFTMQHGKGIKTSLKKNGSGTGPGFNMKSYHASINTKHAKSGAAGIAGVAAAGYGVHKYRQHKKIQGGNGAQSNQVHYSRRKRRG